MPTVTRTSYLEVNGVALSTPAYWIVNLTPVMLSGPTLRGTDAVLPTVAGRRGYQRIIDATVKQFEMVIVGYVDNNGSTNADRMAGLVTNVEYLTANLGLASTANAQGTVTAIWHRPDGTTKSAAVHVERFEVAELIKPQVKAVLELSVDGGTFT